MSAMMNPNILESQWKQVRGRVKQEWSRLTDKQLDQISGHYDKLIGEIQQVYGYTPDKARMEVDRFIEKLSDKPH